MLAQSWLRHMHFSRSFCKISTVRQSNELTQMSIVHFSFLLRWQHPRIQSSLASEIVIDLIPLRYHSYVQAAFLPQMWEVRKNWSDTL